jgi:integrase
LLGLRVSALNFDELVFDVSWQLQRVPLKKGVKRNSDDPNRFDAPPGYEVVPLIGSYALIRPKSKKRRILPMPPELALILVTYLKDQEPNDFGLVWVAEDRQPLRAEDELAAWYAAQERAGVPIIKGHGTRHTANSLIPVDETQRMKFLGHSSVVVNRRYLHEDLAQLRAGQNALAGMLLPGKALPSGEPDGDARA